MEDDLSNLQIARLLLSAFAAFFLIQVIKVVVPWNLKNSKLAMGVSLSTIVAFVLDPRHPVAAATYGVAGAGLAVCIHKAARFFHYAGDAAVFDAARHGRN